MYSTRIPTLSARSSRPRTPWYASPFANPWMGPVKSCTHTVPMPRPDRAAGLSLT